jgi:F1F0 ATPase subunit 2
MSESLSLVLSFLAGIALGTMFFGGLWWTTKKILAPSQPALWFMGSFLARMSVALAGFYFIAHGVWQRLLICLVGFLLARMMVVRFTRGAAP